MNRIYQKYELLFAILWIVIYVIVLSMGDNLSVAIGVEKSVTVVAAGILTAVLLVWLKQNRLMNEYGLCKSAIPAKRLLYYIPLIVMASVNLWFGVTLNLTWAETILYMFSMFFVGFLEEIIFRGLLFRAMAKDNLKTAIIVSSITFGIGHLVNLFNGSGADLFGSLLQVIYAIAAGFLFTMIFYKTKSLWSCIITHGCLNALGAFADETAMTPLLEIGSAAALTVLAFGYAGYIIKKVE